MGQPDGRYRFIIKYVTPLILIAIFGTWLWQGGTDKILLRGLKSDKAANVPFIVLTRLLLLGLFTAICFLVWHAGRIKLSKKEAPS